MKNPHFEKPQADNPHKLTVWQHIFPSRSIERFCNSEGFVQINWFEKNQLFELEPDEAFFCAKRVWSQRAEDNSVRTENAFQNIADLIVTDQVKSLTSEMQIAVTHMYLLWRVRFLHAKNPIPDQSFQPYMSGDNLTKDQQEILEKKGCFFMRPDGTLSSRAMVDILLQRDIGIALNEGADKMQWGIIKAPDGFEFLCADVSINQPLLPVSPQYCLVGGWPSGTATLYGISGINRSLILESERYWFARHPENCPIINRTNVHFQAPRPAFLTGGVFT